MGILEFQQSFVLLNGRVFGGCLCIAFTQRSFRLVSGYLLTDA
jgi:hypothetical protein